MVFVFGWSKWLIEKRIVKNIQWNDQLCIFSPENCLQIKKLRFQTNGNEAEAKAKTTKYPSLYRCYIKFWKHWEKKKKREKTENAKKPNRKTIRYIYHLLRGMIFYVIFVHGWLYFFFLFVCWVLFFLSYLFTYISLFLLMSKLKLNFFFRHLFIYCVHFFFGWCSSSNTAHFTNCDFVPVCVIVVWLGYIVVVFIIIILSCAVVFSSFFSLSFLS